MNVRDITLLTIKNLKIDRSLTSRKDDKINFFDQVIGHIEDLLIDPSFSDLQKQFLETYWREFDDCDENKHSYMQIFKDYNRVIESHITHHLEEKIQGFEMEKLTEELERRKDDLDGEVFEVLYTITDFIAFKQMFLDYRKMKLFGELDLSSAVTIMPLQQTNHLN